MFKFHCYVEHSFYRPELMLLPEFMNFWYKKFSINLHHGQLFYLQTVKNVSSELFYNEWLSYNISN